MTKEDLKELAKRFDLSPAITRRFVRTYNNFLWDRIVTEGRLAITNFGVYTLKEKMIFRARSGVLCYRRSGIQFKLCTNLTNQLSNVFNGQYSQIKKQDDVKVVLPKRRVKKTVVKKVKEVYVPKVVIKKPKSTRTREEVKTLMAHKSTVKAIRAYTWSQNYDITFENMVVATKIFKMNDIKVNLKKFLRAIYSKPFTRPFGEINGEKVYWQFIQYKQIEEIKKLRKLLILNPEDKYSTRKKINELLQEKSNDITAVRIAREEAITRLGLPTFN